MTSQKILLGDCLDVFANEKNVSAFVSDPPGLVGYSGFMGRKWDTAHESFGTFAPMLPTRNKQHARELEHDYNFTKYWAIRYAMAYDIADQHAVNILWTLPRTSHLTANALRAAGWTIKDNLIHLFGTGWAKTGNALAPGQEGWILATKGKPDLDIDACRVPRGGEVLQIGSATMEYGDTKQPSESNPLGSLPKNALLSHCEDCVRVGVKRIKATPPKDDRGRVGSSGGMMNKGSIRSGTWEGFGENGTESVPAWHCLAGCVCGAQSKWDPEKPLPRCPCGETWRWICPVAEVNEQSGPSGTGKMVVGGPDRRNNGVMAARYNSAAARDRSDAIMSFGDQGGSSRFFNTFSYLSKCSSSERHVGCESLYWRANKKNPFGFDQVTREEWETLPTDQRAQGNVHPTVKSYRLMHWLHSLTGATKIVDLSAGSGTGMFTAALDGIEWFGAEVCPEAVLIAQVRHAFWSSLSPEAIEAMKNDSATKAIQKQNKLARLENK